jgi:putative transposase
MWLKLAMAAVFLWISPYLHAAEARRMGRRQGSLLSRVLRGKRGTTTQASLAARLGERTLTIIDLLTRECLAIEVGFSLRAEHVVAAVNRLEYSPGLPERISCDNGSEFAGGQVDLWAYNHKVQMDFNPRGKPTDNATVESFHGKFREECLNAHWLESVQDAKEKIDAWRWDYNENRPHRSLEGLTPPGICDEGERLGVADSLSVWSEFPGPVTSAILSNIGWSEIAGRSHPFQVVKHLWGFTKVRYRGLAKNTARLFTAFVLANRYLLRRKLMPLRARSLS